jgi:hypothetical protein
MEDWKESPESAERRRRIINKLCETCGIKECNTTTWYHTYECTECNDISREKDYDEARKRIVKVVKKKITT